MHEHERNLNFLLPKDSLPGRFIKKYETWGKKRLKNGSHVDERKNWQYKLTEDAENFFLLFNRFVPFNEKKESRLQKDKSPAYESDHKKNYLEAFQNHWKKSQQSYVEHYRSRTKSQLQSFQSIGYKVRDISLKTDSRLIVGLGYKGTLEVGITLHHLYGFPFIPSTAVKGIARAYAEREGSGSDIVHIFGSHSKLEDQPEENRLGAVTFLDGIPERFPMLDIDIMTPHYPGYYESKGEQTPGDWDSPTPIPFITVAADTSFWFGILSSNEKDLEKAGFWLEQGLINLGIGGKTSANYGYFSDPDRPMSIIEEPEDNDEQVEEILEEKPDQLDETESTSTMPDGYHAGVILSNNFDKEYGKIDPDTGEESIQYDYADNQVFNKRDKVKYRLVERGGELRAVDVGKL